MEVYTADTRGMRRKANLYLLSSCFVTEEVQYKLLRQEKLLPDEGQSEAKKVCYGTESVYRVQNRMYREYII